MCLIKISDDLCDVVDVVDSVPVGLRSKVHSDTRIQGTAGFMSGARYKVDTVSNTI